MTWSADFKWQFFTSWCANFKCKYFISLSANFKHNSLTSGSANFKYNALLPEVLISNASPLLSGMQISNTNPLLPGVQISANHWKPEISGNQPFTNIYSHNSLNARIDFRKWIFHNHYECKFQIQIVYFLEFIFLQIMPNRKSLLLICHSQILIVITL